MSALFQPYQLNRPELGQGIFGSNVPEEAAQEVSQEGGQTDQVALPSIMNPVDLKNQAIMQRNLEQAYMEADQSRPKRTGIFGTAIDFAENNPVLTRGLLNAALNWAGTGNFGAGLAGLMGGIAKGYSEQREVKNELAKQGYTSLNRNITDILETQNNISEEGQKLRNDILKKDFELKNKQIFDDYQLQNKIAYLEKQIEATAKGDLRRFELQKQLSSVRAQLSRSNADYNRQQNAVYGSMKTAGDLILRSQFEGKADLADKVPDEIKKTLPKEAFITITQPITGQETKMIKQPKQLTPDEQQKLDDRIRVVNDVKYLKQQLENGKVSASDLRQSVLPIVKWDPRVAAPRSILQRASEIPARNLSGAAIGEKERREFNTIYSISGTEPEDVIKWKLDNIVNSNQRLVNKIKYGSSYTYGSDGAIILNEKDATEEAKRVLSEYKKINSKNEPSVVNVNNKSFNLPHK